MVARKEEAWNQLTEIERQASLNHSMAIEACLWTVV